jgi:hypothetical protein
MGWDRQWKRGRMIDILWKDYAVLSDSHPNCSGHWENTNILLEQLENYQNEHFSRKDCSLTRFPTRYRFKYIAVILYFNMYI